MKKIPSNKIFLFFLFIVSFTVTAQNKYQDRHTECHKISLFALGNLQRLYEEGKLNSVDSLLSEWAFACGNSEFSIRMRTLLQIENGRFDPYAFDIDHYRKLLSYLEDVKFKSLLDTVHENPRTFYMHYYSEPDLVFQYRAFTTKLAQELRKKFPQSEPCSSTQIILDAYSNNIDAVASAFAKEDCSAVPANYYKRHMRSVTNKLLVDAAIYATYWVPYGNNKLLGSHPGLGFLFGAGRKKMFIDIALDFRFGKPKNSYIVDYNGQLTTTNHFFGGYFGLEAGRELKTFNRAKLYVVGGMGLDGFDVIDSDPKKEIEGKSITVLNINTGLSYRWFARDGSFVGLDLRHNFVDYKNPRGTDLSGNVITLRLLAGLLKNDKRQRELEYLNRIFKK